MVRLIHPFSPIGRILFAGYDDSSIRAWDVLKVKNSGLLQAIH